MGATSTVSRRQAAAVPRGLATPATVPDSSAATPASTRFFGYRREAAALLLLVSALYAVLALASFRGDPLRPEVAGSDWVGPVGALVAGALAAGFGLAAWLVPVSLGWFAAPLLRGRASNATLARVAGDIVVMLVTAALLHVAFPRSTSFGAMPIGGVAGELVGELFRALFSTVGSYIVGLTIVSLILIGRAAFSIIAWAQRVEARAGALRDRGFGGLRAIVGAWDEARALEAEARKASEPRIVEAADDAIVLALSDDTGDPTPRPPRRRAAAQPAATQTTTSRAPLADGADTAMAAAGDPPDPAALRRDLANAPTPTPAGAAPAPDAEPLAAPKPERGKRAKKKDAAAEPLIVAPAEDVWAGPAAIQSSLGSKGNSSVAAPELTAIPTALDEEILASPEPRTPPPKPAAAPPIAEEAPAPKAQAAPEPALKIVDTRAALVQEKPSEIVRIVPAFGEGFRLPPPDMLEQGASHTKVQIDEEQLKRTAGQLEKVLSDYGVSGKVEEIHPGPTVTTFEVSPAAGTKVSKVASLADDLALGLSRKVRIVAPIPGKNRIGFEVPNEQRMPVALRDLVEDKRFLDMKAPLPCVLGRDIIGAPFFADLSAMPHVIVAGATGAGKSVGLNVMLVSLLYRKTPADLRLLMIDPKVVELAPFDGIPHMLLPVVTDMKQASNALKWAVDEMERRYQLFANAGTKNISTYNGWVERVQRGEAKPPKRPADAKVSAIAADGTEIDVPAARDGSDDALPEKLPFIVIVVDEFADLMMQQGKDVEASVARLAQKARAAGMHVILATQRPSVDVITGMIKANFPTRIAFRVAQKVDSRTILDEQGAEHLLGRGDMLVKMNGQNDTRRVQCPFVSEEEVSAVTDFLRLQGSPIYDESILKPRDDDGEPVDTTDAEADPMYDAAVRVVADTRRCSTSWLQRKLGIGYNRAAKIVEAMEKKGIVGPANGAKDREVLIGSL